MSRRLKAPTSDAASDGCTDTSDGCGDAGGHAGASRSAASEASCSRASLAPRFVGWRDGDASAGLLVRWLPDASCGCEMPCGCSARGGGLGSCGGLSIASLGRRAPACEGDASDMLSLSPELCAAPCGCVAPCGCRRGRAGFENGTIFFGAISYGQRILGPPAWKPTFLHPLSRGRPSGGRRGARRSSLTGWCGLLPSSPGDRSARSS